MTKAELKALPDGTLIYNGNTGTEAIVRTDCGEKVIEILITIASMSNDSRFADERPEGWTVL